MSEAITDTPTALATLIIDDNLQPSDNPCYVPYKGGLVIQTMSQGCLITFDHQINCSNTITMGPGQRQTVNLYQVRNDFQWTYIISPLGQGSDKEHGPGGPGGGGSIVITGSGGH